MLPAILDPFAEGAAPAVMTRIALEWLIEDQLIDPILEQVAEAQYSRELLLGQLVRVMADVACGFRKSPRAAYLERQLDQVASLSAFYRKLGRMELAVSAAIVRQTADRAHRLIVAAGGLRPEPVDGYAARVLDGNILAGTDHRLAVARPHGSAMLPGMSLAIYEPASGLIRDVVLEENAHTQERALLDQVPVEPGQLWVMDRNFCVRSFLFRIQAAGACFLVRRHDSTLPFEPAGPLGTVAGPDGAEVSEQPIWVDEPGDEGRRHRLRRIVLRLDQPTRGGATEVVLVTNLPESVPAERCCAVYRGRWEIERHFQRLTDLLHCEVPSLGYPRASLFAFCMSVVAGHALAVLKGSLRATHGDELADEVSDSALVQGVSAVYPGMMIAVPPSRWPVTSGAGAASVAEVLNELAARVPVERMLRSRRGPKSARTPRSSASRVHHVATQKLLDKARGVPPPEPATRRKRKPK